MSQNRSSAVMAQRVEAPDSLDHFPTPPWATRALCEWLISQGVAPAMLNCWEPACAEGHMSRALAEYFGRVYASDVHAYGDNDIADFLCPDPIVRHADWIITNPPFRLAQQFAVKADAHAKSGFALLVRTAFLESAERYQTLFRDKAPSDILQFVERVPMFKVRLDRHGSTATAYCWLVWRKNMHGAPFSRTTTFDWIPPCRKRLERDSDYPREA